MSVFASKPLKNTKVEPCQCYCWQFFRAEPHSEVGLEVEVHFVSLALVSCCCVQMEGLLSFDIVVGFYCNYCVLLLHLRSIF